MTDDELKRLFRENAVEMQCHFSHAELDRRMRVFEEGQRTLEETVSDLQARVDRIEGSTH